MPGVSSLIMTALLIASFFLVLGLALLLGGAELLVRTSSSIGARAGLINSFPQVAFINQAAEA